MSDQTKDVRTMGWPFPLPNVTDGAQLQMETWFKEQAALLEETQKTLAAWLSRRQDAVAATARTFQAMVGCRDVGALAATYGDWLADSMNRIVADMNDARDEALRLAEFAQRSMAALAPRGSEAAPAEAAAAPPPAPRETRRARGAAKAEAADTAREPAAE